MATKFWYIGVLVAFILINITNGNMITDKRIKALQRKVAKIERSLKKIEKREVDCNDTMYTVSEKVDEVSGILKHVYKGPLYTRMDLTEGYKGYDKVLLTLPDAMEKCVNSYKGTFVERDRAEITCLQQIMWRYEEPPKARQMRRYTLAARKLRPRRVTFVGPRPRPRLRKEYRTLSDVERQRFHDAMNFLYEAGIIEVLAEIHKAADPGAHGGPSFLPWHRIFLLHLEYGLRLFHPQVTLPYWDSTMDDARENPTNSIMWTSKLVGNGAGQVITGDFAGWSTQNDFLSRAYGEKSRLVRKSDVANMMTKCSYEEISLPFGAGQFRLEQFHNNVHRWVGGDMGAIGTAPYDPVFYLHHCYIDYLWEKFREHQKDDCGLDPEYDYPDVNQEHHKFDDELLKMEYFTVADGMSDYWTRYVYRYQDSPTCENNCGPGDLLICDYIKNCCIPKGRFQGPTDIQAIPLPGLVTSTPKDLSRLFVSTTHCDHYLDPECHHEHSMLRVKAGLPIQPGEELRIIELMVGQNRGRQFSSDPGELRNLQTLKEDVEDYERRLQAYEAAEAVRRREELARLEREKLEASRLDRKKAMEELERARKELEMGRAK